MKYDWIIIKNHVNDLKNKKERIRKLEEILKLICQD